MTRGKLIYLQIGLPAKEHYAETLNDNIGLAEAKKHIRETLNIISHVNFMSDGSTRETILHTGNFIFIDHKTKEWKNLSEIYS